MELVVEKGDGSMRLDRLIMSNLPDVTIGMFHKLLRKGAIRVDEEVVREMVRLQEGQKVEISDLPEGLTGDEDKEDSWTQRDTFIPPALITRTISSFLFKGDDVLVINKMPGIAVQGGTKVKYSLDDILLKIFEPSNIQPRLVHRIDKSTTGILVFALNRRTAQELTAMFARRQVTKVYVAIVKGYIRDNMEITDPIFEDEKSSAIDHENGKPSQTFVYPVLDGPDYTVLFAIPTTGRKHQIRLHLHHIGFPIIGDSRYADFKVSDDMMLHAFYIKLPGVGEFKAQLPQYMSNIVKDDFLAKRLRDLLAS